MKKTYKLIFFVVLAFVVITVIRNRPKEDLRATADLKEELSKITFDTEITPKIEEQIVDFSTCLEDDNFSIETPSGKSSIEIIGIEGEYCLVKTSYENVAGNYSNECRVPLIKGKTTFSTLNFENISQYCAIREDGSGLLELE